MLTTAMLAVALLAQQGADPAACAVIEPDDERLSCYDAFFRRPPVQAPAHTQAPEAAGREGEESAAASASSAPDAPRAPAAAVAPALPVPATTPPVRTQEEVFGLTPAQLAELDRSESSAPVLDRVEVRVSSVTRTGLGHIVLTFDNGQRWMEVAPSDRVRFRAGQVVTIRRAALGSFLARGPTSGGGVRVRRMD